MRRFFTKNLFLLIFSAVAVAATGQSINTLTVNSPAGIAGNYEVIRAAFGSTSNTPITANAVFTDDGVAPLGDGCTAPTNNLTGSIAFVDRGTCSFVIKAKALQVAGAIAVVICQNADVWPFVGGGTDASITVPVFTLKLADCTKIRTDIIAGGVNATLGYTCAERNPAYGENVVWGKNAGEGDFDGGLNDWTIDKENTWEYKLDANISGGAFGGVQMTSFSACDGAMVFNSDFRDTGGNGDNQGSGNGGCIAPCTGALISPAIDLSSHNIVGLFVEFHQGLRQFQSQYYLITSKDGGLTWPDTLQFNTEYPVNSASVAGERKKLALKGYAGVKNFRMKFEHVGNYYYWGIDDVVLINEFKADAQVNDNFYAAASSLRVPAGQLEEMPFLTDVSNVGNDVATDVKVELVITDPQNANAELARLTNSYGTMEVGAIIENKPFPDTYTPPATPGRYNGSYVISSVADVTTANNTRSFFFDVTENTFANLLPEESVTPANYMSYVLTPWTVGTQVTYYSAGNIYYVKDGKNVTIDKVRFGLANTIASINEAGFINVDVYEWVDEDGNNECAPLERTKVGTNSVFLDASITNARKIELPIWALDDEGNAAEGVEVDLKDKTTYVVMAHTSPLDPSAPRFQLLGYTGRTFSAFDRSTNYSAVSYAFDTLGIDRSAGSLFGLTGTSAEDVEDRNYEIVQNGATQSAVFLEMDVKQSTSTFDIADKAQVNTFPNPASREIFIDVTLEKVSQNVRVDLVSIDGRTAVSKAFSNVQDSRLRLDLSGVVSGTYSVLIHTDKGLITRKVVVQK
jgi:Secretion system C-terminal sorting domain/PA domain